MSLLLALALALSPAHADEEQLVILRGDAVRYLHRGRAGDWHTPAPASRATGPDEVLSGAVTMRVVDRKGRWVRVAKPLQPASDLCTREGRHGPVDLELWAHRDDLLSVTTRAVDGIGPDGEVRSLSGGHPVLPSDDGTWWVDLAGDVQRVELPEDIVGTVFSSSTLTGGCSPPAGLAGVRRTSPRNPPPRDGIGKPAIIATLVERPGPEHLTIPANTELLLPTGERIGRTWSGWTLLDAHVDRAGPLACVGYLAGEPVAYGTDGSLDLCWDPR